MEMKKIEFVKTMLQSILAFFRPIAAKQTARKCDLWQWATEQYAPDANGRSIYAVEFGYRIMAAEVDDDTWAATYAPCVAIIKMPQEYKEINNDIEASLKNVFTHVYDGSFVFAPESEDVYDAYIVMMDDFTGVVVNA